MNPTRRADILVRPLGEGLVLYDPLSMTTHTLNQTAGFIWAQCDGKTSTPSIAAALTRTFDVDAGAAAADVEEVIRQLAELGLLVVEGTA
ncbi:MAG: HPr-rel-A system PqqD family peptide chaperone [Candidatus Tectomicrobia bacterium]|nr:HPr-rel-A system PqqD family peptide chaperone [Candidatus Tectomicrobia bacterium]